MEISSVKTEKVLKNLITMSVCKNITLIILNSKMW